MHDIRQQSPGQQKPAGAIRNVIYTVSDEMGLTPEKFEELMRTGKTEVAGPELEGDDRARFFLWYYINYVADHLAEDC